MRTVWRSPLGGMVIEGDGQAIGSIRFAEADEGQAADHPLLLRAIRQLEEYFQGRRRAFDLPLAPRGTPFQQAVWQALAQIPYGETRSYAQVARMIGRANACRAVGSACRANPLLIVVPCHRVIGAGGALTGFAAGLERKQRLLALEQEALFAQGNEDIGTHGLLL